MAQYEIGLLLAAALLVARLPAPDAQRTRLPSPDAQHAPLPAPDAQHAPLPAPDVQYDYDDDESDPVPFMIVLEHEDGWMCAASLVSLRTAISTARCASGRGEARGARALWALAAALLARSAAPGAGARRVVRVALAGDGRDPTDPARDLAVLELEAPFGRAARAVPILLQTDPHAVATRCHAVHALPTRAGSSAGPRVRFRVRSLHRAPERDCATRVPLWAAARAHLQCLGADDGDMCERDLGGGVVCDGKLSGVLSALGGAGACGATLAAQDVARARRFLHCAHTMRLCGRGACASQCTERRLLPDDGDDGPAPAASHSTDSVPPAEDATNDNLATSAPVASAPAAPRPAPPVHPTPTPATPRRTSLATIPFFGDEHASSPRHALVFEPNRPDFKAAQTRSPRVRLKAGEYGDNAADYAADDPPPPPRRAHEPARPPPTPTRRPTRELPAPALQLASTEPPLAAGSARLRAAPASVILYSMIMLFGK